MMRRSRGDVEMASRSRGDAGMVTAELAVAIPVVVLVLVACLAGLVAAVDQIRCVDAARLGGRAAARGDPIEQVRASASKAAPAGAVVNVAKLGRDAVVTVHVRSGGWGGVVPTWELSATARTPLEVARP